MQGMEQIWHFLVWISICCKHYTFLIELPSHFWQLVVWIPVGYFWIPYSFPLIYYLNLMLMPHHLIFYLKKNLPLSPSVSIYNITHLIVPIIINLWSYLIISSSIFIIFSLPLCTQNIISTKETTLFFTVLFSLPRTWPNTQ